MSPESPSKRRRVGTGAVAVSNTTMADLNVSSGTKHEADWNPSFNEPRLNSLERVITPPPGNGPSQAMTSPSFDRKGWKQLSTGQKKEDLLEATSSGCYPVTSSVSLSRIRDLPDSYNIDTVTLSDILGNPLIKEVWIFNYLHDVPFIMSHLDPDVRDDVQVKILHGSWKREDPHRLSVEEDARQYANVQVIIAHMPEMFGTHHSKSIVLIRHDGLAQIVIHTANMIQQDWANLTQAVWRSPLLPLCDSDQDADMSVRIGSGRRFKIDFLNYLCAYQGRTRPLVEQIRKYDFSAIRAALIASVPCKQCIEQVGPEDTRFGWSGLRHTLKAVPVQRNDRAAGPAQLAVQISSVGSLGASYKWLEPFLKSLAVTADSATTDSSTLESQGAGKPETHIIFPTTGEVRRSLDGYASGASIHMRLGNKAMQIQLAYMRAMLRHWAGNESEQTSHAAKDGNPDGVHHALRRRAAPHIKTYIRFSNANMDSIDWAMMTSANLSKQAWGEAAKEGDRRREIKIASYELGVMIWPALFEDDLNDTPVQSVEQRTGKVVMLPVFGRDQPTQEQLAAVGQDVGKVVGFRMPYDLPLVPYAKAELPWCATAEHGEPDWKGVIWQGYSRRA